MEKLIEAIKSGDLIEAKREFNAKMAVIKEAVLADEKLAIAGSIVTEDETNDDDDEDEDEDEDDEE